MCRNGTENFVPAGARSPEDIRTAAGSGGQARLADSRQKGREMAWTIRQAGGGVGDLEETDRGNRASNEAADPRLASRTDGQEFHVHPAIEAGEAGDGGSA